MIERKGSVLWCKVFEKYVKATLMKADQRADPLLGLPEGWSVTECLDKDTECFGKECPFTMDGGEWPFGLPAPRLRQAGEPAEEVGGA